MTPRNNPKKLVYHTGSSSTRRETILEKPDIFSYFQIFACELTIQQVNHDIYLKIGTAIRRISVKTPGQTFSITPVHQP